MRVHLRTGRLTIRRFTPADEDNLVALNSDPEVMRYITGGLAEPGRDQVRDEIIPFHLAAYEQHPGFGTWAAEDSATGDFLGWFHLRPRRGDGAIDLGYRLRRAAWGRGLATEGSVALIGKAFTEHDIDRIVAETLAVNLPSRRVLDKCGLTHVRTFDRPLPYPIEGSEHGVVEYELTRDTWAAVILANAKNN
ncbi:MAG TPA: GNAT family N-acetyltransferase [Streptosporangiaceae bacterium]